MKHLSSASSLPAASSPNPLLASLKPSIIIVTIIIIIVIIIVITDIIITNVIAMVKVTIFSFVAWPARLTKHLRRAGDCFTKSSGKFRQISVMRGRMKNCELSEYPRFRRNWEYVPQREGTYILHTLQRCGVLSTCKVDRVKMVGIHNVGNRFVWERSLIRFGGFQVR